MKKLFTRIKSGGSHQRNTSSKDPSFTGQGRSQFVDLPTEVILKILQTPDINLVTMAKLSRYLNTLTLSHVLSSHGVHDPNTSLTIKITGREVGYDQDGNRDLLSLLSLAFGITKTETLTVHFEFPLRPNPAFIRHLAREYNRFTVFLRRLERVHTIVLNLEEHNVFRLGMARIEMLNAWTTVTVGLFNACIANGCEVLEVRNGGYPASEYRVRVFDPNNIMAQAIQYPVKKKHGQQTKTTPTDPHFLMVTTPTVKGHDWEIEGVTPALRPLVASALKPAAREKAGSLRSLRISTPMLLYPPHSNWLYQLLSAPLVSTQQSQHLMTLTLQGIHELSTEWWHSIFSWLGGPLQQTLQHLTIKESTALPKEPLLRFLEGLRGLKTLELGEPLPPFALGEVEKGNQAGQKKKRGEVEVERTRHKLAEGVTSICAPSDYLRLLVGLTDDDTTESDALNSAYPSLSTLHIVPRCFRDTKHGHHQDGSGYSFKDISPILFKKFEPLSRDFVLPGCLEPTIQPILAHLPPSSPSTTSIEVILDLIIPNITIVPPSESTSSSTEVNWERVTELIVPAHIFTTTTRSRDGDIDAKFSVDAWTTSFAGFTNVRKVTMTSHSENGNLPLISPRRPNIEWMKSMARDAVEGIKKVCIRLERVEFDAGLMSGGEVYVVEVKEVAFVL